MNLFERAGIQKPRNYQDLWQIRQERIKKEGSEFFTWRPGVTIAGARTSIEIKTQFPMARKYMPLDYVQVANNDAVDLTLTINGQETLPVPIGTIITVSDKWLYEIGITNDDAVAPTVVNRITVTLQRQPETIDSWARRQRNG